MDKVYIKSPLNAWSPSGKYPGEGLGDQVPLKVPSPILKSPILGEKTTKQSHL